MFKKLLFFTLTFALFALAICDNSITISQTVSSSWEGHSTWEVCLTNTGERTVKDLTLVVESGLTLEKPENFWSMELSSANRYHFPAWLSQNGGLKNGTKHCFGYTNGQTTSAVFSVCDVQY
ncbi:hypothetical protein RB653_005355 [Dictyostelium firmibasis]|uniref:Carbohydrate binding domain-containing protein n=1 Tax=Dictyostelium firmibasis TaxID=79012 RepID=A0AAN7YY27_9MYCE